MTPEDVKQDTRIKWGLLVFSLATIATLAISLYIELPGSEWQTHRREYAKILAATADDELGQDIRDRFQMQVQQQVLPELGTVDRCTTCHAGIDDPRMASQKQPFRSHPGELLRIHPPESFGCTVCHRGQGRALTFAAAKGEKGSHWEYPMLPPEFAQAECGRCHTQLPDADPSIVREGMRLIRKYHCTDCHQVDGVGNPKGLDLSLHGLRLLQRKWWANHPAYGPGKDRIRPAYVAIRADEKAELQAFLRTRHGASRLARGRRLYDDFGCGGCHKQASQGGTLGPDLSHAGRKTVHEFSFAHVEGEETTSNWLLEHFLNPSRIVPDSDMPRLEMGRDDTLALTTAVLSHRRESMVLGKYLAPDSKVSLGTDGGGMFRRYCGGCHGSQGEGTARMSFGYSVPGIMNAGFLRVAEPDLIRRVAAYGRPKRNMPTWKDNIRAVTLEAILKHIDQQRRQPEDPSTVARQPTDPTIGRQVYKRNCSFCHGDRGEGDIGPKLNDWILLNYGGKKVLLTSIAKGRPGTPMPSWAELPASQVAGLLGLFEQWEKAQGKAPNLAALPHSQPHMGKVSYARHCASCHGARGEGNWGPALHNPVLLESASRTFLAASVERCRVWANTPRKGVPSGPPPLAMGEVAAIVDYVRSWRDSPPPVPRPRYRRLRGGDPINGKTLFDKKCSGCHGPKGVDGISPSIGSPAVTTLVADGFVTATLVTGRDGTVMEPLGTNAPNDSAPITRQQVRDVVTYWRSLQPGKAASIDIKKSK